MGLEERERERGEREREREKERETCREGHRANNNKREYKSLKKVLWNASESQWPVLTLVNLDDLSCLMLRKTDSRNQNSHEVKGQARGKKRKKNGQKRRKRERV